MTPELFNAEQYAMEKMEHVRRAWLQYGVAMDWRMMEVYLAGAFLAGEMKVLQEERAERERRQGEQGEAQERQAGQAGQAGRLQQEEAQT